MHVEIGGGALDLAPVINDSLDFIFEGAYVLGGEGSKVGGCLEKLIPQKCLLELQPIVPRKVFTV